MKQTKQGKEVLIPEKTDWWRKSPMRIMLLLLLTIVIYGKTIRYDFALDDAIVITQNMFTKKGIRGIPGILSHDSFYGFFKKQGKDKLVTGGRYRPLSLVLFALTYSFFGGNPAAFHLLNLLFYAALVVLIYLFFTRLFQEFYKGKRADAALAAWIGALLFAWHPLHIEVVANIKGADEILALLFSLAAMYLVLFLRDKPSRAGYHFISGLLAFLAMMSKENAIVLWLWLPVILWITTRLSIKEILKRTAGVFVGIVLYLLLRFSILGGFSSGGISKELMNNPFLKVVDGRYLPYTLTEKAASVCYTLWEYFRLLFFPHPLTHDYYPRTIPITAFDDPHVILGLLVSAGLLTAMIWGILRRRKWVIIPVIYLIPLAIVSNIFFPVGTHMGERFAFFSSLSLSAGAGMLWMSLHPKRRMYLSILLLLFLLGFGFKNMVRIPVWKDDFSLFTHDVRLSPNSAKARNAAAGALVDAAYRLEDADKKKKYYRMAVEHEKQALRIHPNYDVAQYIMGLAQFGLMDYDAALLSVQRAIELSPDKEEYQDALYSIYMAYGKHKGEKEGNANGAIKYLKKALELKADDPELYRLLGVANGVIKHYPEAIRYFKTALQFQPGNRDLYHNLSLTYRFMGMPDSSRYYSSLADNSGQGKH